MLRNLTSNLCSSNKGHKYVYNLPDKKFGTSCDVTSILSPLIGIGISAFGDKSKLESKINQYVHESLQYNISHYVFFLIFRNIFLKVDIHQYNVESLHHLLQTQLCLWTHSMNQECLVCHG